MFVDHLVVQERDVVAAALELYRAGTGSDFADCMILEVACAAGHTPLATFDRKLARAEGVPRLRGRLTEYATASPAATAHAKDTS